MEMIQSFSVDHTKIVPGIFTSRVDKVDGGVVTTYDIRLKKPNREPVIDVAAMHSLEHLIAIFLRNDPQWKDEVIYWGPMGCLTGFYLILAGEPNVQAVSEIVHSVFVQIREWPIEEGVPGAKVGECGNPEFHDLRRAKRIAAAFSVAKFETEYPKK